MTHPSTDFLDRFSEGSCDLTERLIIDIHLSTCCECQSYVRQRCANNEISSEEIISPSAESLSLLQNINESIAQAENNQKNQPSLYSIPQEFALDLPPEANWTFFSFWPSKGRVARVLQDINGPYELYVGVIDANATSPSHNHLHEEQTLVLEGEYTTGGKIYQAGAWLNMKPGEAHEPGSAGQKRCVCLIRSHKKGFKFTGRATWRNALLAIAHTLDK